MRKILIALGVGTIIGLAPMFAEQADAQRFGGRGGGIGRIGGGPAGIGRVGIGGGIGRVGVARVGGIGRVGIGRVGIGRVGIGGRHRRRLGPAYRRCRFGRASSCRAAGRDGGCDVRLSGAWAFRWPSERSATATATGPATGLAWHGTRTMATSTRATRRSTADMAAAPTAANTGKTKSGSRAPHATRAVSVKTTVIT